MDDGNLLAQELESSLALAQYRLQLALDIKNDIDEYCIEAYNDGFRTHLGASVIGDPCSRKLWYSFRWVKAEIHSGRQSRLFNRGHREEARFMEWLKGIGAIVYESEIGAQYKFSAHNGHSGGSLDGIALLPPKYGVIRPFLLEFKTNGTGKGFADLPKYKVSKAKPMHFAQMSIYGKAYNLPYALYFNINKNDDDLHVEVVELDFNLATTLENKAGDIINSQLPPAKYGLSEAVLECKICHFVGICHRGEKIEKNCRSCRKCTPAENAAWHCAEYNGHVPKEFIPNGCDKWEPIV